MPDVVEVLGAAHREVEKVADGDSLAAGGIEQETEGKQVLGKLDGWPRRRAVRSADD